MDKLNQTADSIKELFQEFETYCPPNMYIHVIFGSHLPPMAVLDIKFRLPNLVIFLCANNGHPYRVFQTIDQLNFSLTYAPISEGEPPKKPVGFDVQGI